MFSFIITFFYILTYTIGKKKRTIGTYIPIVRTYRTYVRTFVRSWYVSIDSRLHFPLEIQHAKISDRKIVGVCTNFIK